MIITLYPPFSVPQEFFDCEIDDEFVPELSFRGRTTDTGKRVSLTTTLPYTILRRPINPEPDGNHDVPDHDFVGNVIRTVNSRTTFGRLNQ